MRSAPQARDAAEPLEVDRERIGARPGDDELRADRHCLFFQGVVVDLTPVVEAVGFRLVVAAGEVQAHAVRQVPAFGEREPQDHVARLQHREVRGEVRLRARVRLHVHGHLDPGGFAEELLRTRDRELFDDVNVLAAAVVAAAGVALGVLVGEHRPLRREHRGRGVVFAGDQLDVRFLTGALRFNGGEDLGVLRFDHVGTVDRGVEAPGGMIHGESSRSLKSRIRFCSVRCA